MTASARKTRRSKTEPSSARADANERWEQITRVATDLFRRKGFSSTSMQDISDAVGLLKGSLYYYIDSKEDLLFEILRDLHKDGERIIAQVEFDSGDPLHQLRTYLKRAAVFGALNADRLGIFLRDFHYVPAERQSEIISERRMYQKTVVALVTEAKELGLTNPNLDVSLAATLISGAVAGVHEWLHPDGPRPLDQAAEDIAEILTNSVRVPVELTAKPAAKKGRPRAKVSSRARRAPA
ncbi:MAG: TetR family transcriptional regulator [Hyphomonadaceae bacterium]|nr:TetR family transcriptional regulator [Hyphomonadaceae bacterium]